MSKYSLLGRVVPGVTLQVENAATEALAYLLQEYEKAREAFVGLASVMGPVGEDDLTFGTQVRMWGGGIPDLVGADSDGTEVLLVESKFWAPLTPNQPTGYLSRLPTYKEGLVLFIAPEDRNETLWQQLVDRCKAAGLEPREETGDPPHWRAVRISEVGKLAYVSWFSVLNRLDDELKSDGEVHGAHEVWQLRGLCERLAERDPTKGPVEEQLQAIVKEIVESLVEKGILDTKGYRAARGPSFYRRYGSIRSRINWFVEYDLQRATDLGESLLWVGGPSEEELVRRLSVDVEVNPPRFYRRGKELLFPLMVPPGADPSVVVRSLVSQIEELVELL